MSLKGKFRQPVYKEDLMPVIKQGIFVAFIGGLLIGALNLLIAYLGRISLVWMLSMIMAIYMAKRIRNAYLEYHIWYSVIAVAGFILGFYFMNVVSQMGLLFVYNVVEIDLYVLTLNPIPYFIFLYPLSWFGSGVNLFSSLLSILFFGIAIYYAFHYSKSR